MSRSLRAVPSGGGVAALAERVLLDVDALAERMGDAYRREIPEYAAMSAGEMTGVVLPTSRRLVTTFLDAVVSGRAMTGAELRVFEESGRERLRLGLPLEAVLHAFRVGGREAWTALCAAVPPGEEVLLADASWSRRC